MKNPGGLFHHVKRAAIGQRGCRRTGHCGFALGAAVLRLTQSPFTRDYELCWRARCETLHELTAPANRTKPPGTVGGDASIDVVDVRACRRKRAN